jgi:hypothetical protein
LALLWLYKTVKDVWPNSYFSLVRSAEVMRRQLHHPKQICKGKDGHWEDKRVSITQHRSVRTGMNIVRIIKENNHQKQISEDKQG